MGGLVEVAGSWSTGLWGAVVLLIGAPSAASVWLLLGWPREDACSTLRACGEMAAREIELLVRAFVQVGKRVGSALGLSLDAGGEVGLGDVSEMIDIVRLGLKAGISFDASLALYCEGRTGKLSERMARARFMWQTGLVTREQGLLGVARDVGVRPLESFAIAVVQALELGAPLADTLEGQAREIRAMHRAEVERQIERAPVKLLIPTGTLILPALLLSIVGPLVAAGGMG